MKFQKTAIAVTIAGFAAAPMMASADTVLSGTVQVKYQGTDADGDDPDMAAGDVRLAIGSEHELNSGLIGYGNLQLNLDDLTGEGGLAGLGLAEQADIADPDGSLTDEDIVELTSAATVSSDNVYVGVKGGFGDVRLGEIPLAVEYGQLANDIHDVGTTVVDGISYTGTFGIFGFGLNHSLEEDSDMIGAGAKFNFAGATIGLGFEDRLDQARYAVGASYAIAGFTIAAHYWAGEDDFDPQVNVDTTADDQVQTTGFDINDTTNFAVQVGYNIAGVAIGLTFSVLEDDNGIEGVEAVAAAPDMAAAPGVAPTVRTDEATVIRLDLAYDLGGGTELSTRIQSTSTDQSFEDDRVVADADDLVEYRVMLTKSF